MQDGEQFLSLNGVHHWVKVAGARHGTTPLIAIHGGPGGNHYVFERTAGLELEQTRTVVYYEQRGSGRSNPPSSPAEYSIPLLVSDLHALMDALDIAQADLLGYSFGGGLALEYAHAQPQRVRRLVLQAPALRLHDPQITLHQLAGFQAVAQDAVLERIQSILLDNLPPAEQLDHVWNVVDTPTVDLFLFQNQEKAAWNRQMWNSNGLTNTGDMNRALNAQPATNTSAQLHTILQPTLMLAGRHDRNIPLSMFMAWERAMPDAKLIVFEESAHFPDIEETGRYVQTVLDFLA